MRRGMMQGGSNKPNTWIGGVGSYITTPAELAAVSPIIESQIFNFKNDGKGNISFSFFQYPLAFEGLSHSLIYNNPNITFFKTTTPFIIGASCFRSCANLIFVDVPNVLEKPRGSAFRDCFIDINIRLDKVVDYNTNGAGYGQKFKRMYAPLVSVFGSTATQDNQWENGGGNPKNVYVHPDALTNNAGGVEGDLARLISIGKNVQFVTNRTAPSAITNLTSGSKSTTAVQLNFTPPSSLNFLDFYEVWIKEVGVENYRQTQIPWQEITASGQAVTGLKSLTSYKIKVVACDTFWNRSAFSNEITVTTL